MPPPRSHRASTRTRETTARVVVVSRATKRARASSSTPAFSARIIRELDLALADADAHASDDAGDDATTTTRRRRGKRKNALTLARAERLWERAIERGGATETNAEATVRAIANGGGRGCGGGVVVDDDAARFLLAKVTSTFGEEEESTDGTSEKSQRSRSGTKRNLSARFEQTASEGDDDDQGDGGDAEATSEKRGVKRRKLTLAERMVRRVELTMTRSTSKELRIIDGRRFDRAMCAIVDDGVENVGKVDLACAKALEMSAKATGSRSFGITPVGLQTMRMVVDGGFGDAYAFTVAADAKRHLSALIEAEERLGPEIADVPVKKRRRLARVLMNLSNFARPPQYRHIEGEKYDEAACHIADVSMETSGRIDLACAKAIHASVRDGGSHWGITEIELRTLKMLARGGRGDLTVKLEAAAKRYLETVVEKEETLLTTTTTEEDTESDDEPSSKRAKTGVFTHLKKLVRRKQYRYIDGGRFDEDACNIADDSMERIGRIDLECAKTIHASILDGGSRWGITATEYATVRLFIDGGRDDVLYICDDDAKLYLLNVLGTQAVEEAANVTPPTKVHVRQAPASALQSALKNPPPSALKTAAKSAAKKKGVIFTPSRRFQTRTYVPSPTSGNSDEEVEDDTDEEEETNDDANDDEVVVDSRLEETREENDEDEDEDFEPIKRASDDALTVYAPSIMTAFYDSMQFWMTPVSVLDTAAACIVTLAVFCVAHVAIIATFEATIAPASVTVLTKTETSM